MSDLPLQEPNVQRPTNSMVNRAEPSQNRERKRMFMCGSPKQSENGREEEIYRVRNGKESSGWRYRRRTRRQKRNRCCRRLDTGERELDGDQPAASAGDTRREGEMKASRACYRRTNVRERERSTEIGLRVVGGARRSWRRRAGGWRGTRKGGSGGCYTKREGRDE